MLSQNKRLQIRVTKLRKQVRNPFSLGETR